MEINFIEQPFVWLEDYADEHKLKLNILYNSDTKLYWVKFNKVYEVAGKNLRFIMGRGKSVNCALKDYAKRLSHKRIQLPTGKEDDLSLVKVADVYNNKGEAYVILSRTKHTMQNNE